jgi:hypothetical protein
MLNTTVNAGAQLSTAQLKQNGLSLAENSRVALLPDSDTSIITSLTLGLKQAYPDSDRVHNCAMESAQSWACTA